MVQVCLVTPAGSIHRNSIANLLMPALDRTSGVPQAGLAFVQALFAMAVLPPLLCFCLNYSVRAAKFNSLKKKWEQLVQLS